MKTGLALGGAEGRSTPPPVPAGSLTPAPLCWEEDTAPGSQLVDERSKEFLERHWGELTPHEVAKRLHVPLSDVTAYARETHLPARKHARSRFRSRALSVGVMSSVSVVGALVWLGAPGRTARPSVEDLVASLGSVVYCSPKRGDRCVYLVGQEHFFVGTGRTGKIAGVARQKETLPEVQAQIYLILDRLVRRRGLELVVGEGLPSERFHMDPLGNVIAAQEGARLREEGENYDAAVGFFTANPKEVAYATQDLFHPGRIQTWGIDDGKELRRLAELEHMSFDVTLATVPTWSDAQNPEKAAKRDRLLAPLDAEKDRLNDVRSTKAVDESWLLADRLAGAGEIATRDLAVVFGSKHVALMVELLQKRRCTLYVIKPRSAADFTAPRK